MKINEQFILATVSFKCMFAPKLIKRSDSKEGLKLINLKENK